MYVFNLQINQKVAMAMLKNLGVEVKTANNGLEAVTAVQRSSFDLVLMDCQVGSWNLYPYLNFWLKLGLAADA